MGDNPLSFCFQFLLLFLSQGCCCLYQLLCILWFSFLCQEVASNALKVRGVDLLFRNIFCAPRCRKSLKSSDRDLFLKRFDSKPNTFIYFSLVLSFLIWAIEVCILIRSLQPVLFFHRFLSLFALSLIRAFFGISFLGKASQRLCIQ